MSELVQSNTEVWRCLQMSTHCMLMVQLENSVSTMAALSNVSVTLPSMGSLHEF